MSQKQDLLLHRDRVTEYFAKSLEVTQGHSKWQCIRAVSISLKLFLYRVLFLRY